MDGETVKHTDGIEKQIQAMFREISRGTKHEIEKLAKRENVSPESIIWLLVEQYSSGHLKSLAYHDAPRCVIHDGLIVESHSNETEYTCWTLTEKAWSILNPLFESGTLHPNARIVGYKE